MGLFHGYPQHRLEFGRFPTSQALPSAPQRPGAPGKTSPATGGRSSRPSRRPPSRTTWRSRSSTASSARLGWRVGGIGSIEALARSTRGWENGPDVGRPNIWPVFPTTLCHPERRQWSRCVPWHRRRPWIGAGHEVGGEQAIRSFLAMALAQAIDRCGPRARCRLGGRRGPWHRRRPWIGAGHRVGGPVAGCEIAAGRGIDAGHESVRAVTSA